MDINQSDSSDSEENINESQKRYIKKTYNLKTKDGQNNEANIHNSSNIPIVTNDSQVTISKHKKSRNENSNEDQSFTNKSRSRQHPREKSFEENTQNLEVKEESSNLNLKHEVTTKRNTERKKRHSNISSTGSVDPFLINSLQFTDDNCHNYPFEDSNDSYQQEEDETIHSEDFSERNHTPIAEKPTKKIGGLMKIFSFKKKNRSNSVPKLDGKQWKSSPEIFNPAEDNHLSFIEKSLKKITGNPGSQKTHVILLDGMEVEFLIDQKTIGRDLFNQVCDYLDLLEKDFFGLTYVNSKVQTWFWLEMEKRISKQLMNGEDWTFNFQVKFYPPEPMLLQEDLTRYLLTLQVRQDVFTGKLPCSWITQALLGSFMVQSELGDYDELEHGDGIEYLHDFEFILNQSDQLLEKISELHQKHANMSPDKADIKYLETAKRLEQYGVDLHPARDNDDIEIYVGVCYQGVLIYKEKTRIGRFAWPKVLRISYKRNYFYLKIRSDRYDDSVAIVGFKLFNHNLAKRLWKNAVEQHTFFRIKEPQNMKQVTRIIPASVSKYNYSGKTLHQYRSMNILRDEPLKFDRSISKRRSIGSMPAGLENTGIQYSSMHSLNRSHPRDMTMGKIKSVEYLSSKRPESIVSSQGSQVPQQARSQVYKSNKEDDRHLSFQSGDSINATDSYTVHNDDQASLPSMSFIKQVEYSKKNNNKNTKSSPLNEATSDDDVITMKTEHAKIVKRQYLKNKNISQGKLEENNLKNGKVFENTKSKSTNQNGVFSDGNMVAQPDPIRYNKKQKPKGSRNSENVYEEDSNCQPVCSNPVKKHTLSSNKNGDFSNAHYIPESGNNLPLKKHNPKSSYQKCYNELSDDGNKGKGNFGVGINPTISNQKTKILKNEKPNSHNIVNRKSESPTMCRTPSPPIPPPPELMHLNESSHSSGSSSSLERHLPPPPSPIDEMSYFVAKPKLPPVMLKSPFVEPERNNQNQFIMQKHSFKYSDESSDDEML